MSGDAPVSPSPPNQDTTLLVAGVGAGGRMTFRYPQITQRMNKQDQIRHRAIPIAKRTRNETILYYRPNKLFLIGKRQLKTRSVRR